MKGAKIRKNAGKSVLIVTNKRDVAADWIVRELDTRGVPIVRLNTEDLPGHSVVWSPNGPWEIVTPFGRTVGTESIRAVWYRRPGKPFGDRVMQDSPPDVLNAQWRAMLQGLLADERGVRWMNHPFRNSRAESKMLQLTTAQDCGFRIPRTVVTNRASVAADISSHWTLGAVVKALDSPLFATDGDESFVFTNRLRRSHLARKKAFATAPVIVQERLHPKRDIRATVVGRRVLAAEAVGVRAQDWRLEPSPVQFRPIRLRKQTVSRCVQMVRRLGLRFGAIDLIMSHGRTYFLELNPNGEWGWLEAAGIPIASAIADELLSSDQT